MQRSPGPLVCLPLLALLACSGEKLRNFSTVEEGILYRSGRLEAQALRHAIETYDLKTVIDLGGWNHDAEQWAANQSVADEMDVTRYAIHMLGDGRANPNGYVAVLRLLANPDNHPVLVHCAGGSERTSAAVVLYRHLIQGRLIQPSYEESFEHGHVAEDYEWIAYLADWTGEISDAWRSGGWIEGLPPIDPKPGVRIDATPTPSQWVPPDYAP